LKTLDFSFCTFAFLPKVDRGYIIISLNLLLLICSFRAWPCLSTIYLGLPCPVLSL
jgi:hypothetical protein